MTKGRLEAFSDGVIAIIITIMVLEIKAPHASTIESLNEILPQLFSYILSFMFVLIYWNNHHHLFQAVKVVNGRVLLANGLLLFSLSLIPFFTSWMGENHFAPMPVMFYGINGLVCGVSYNILSSNLIKAQGKDSDLALAVGNNKKENISTISYITGVVFASFYPYISCALYLLISIMWLIPDKRIEKTIV